MSPGQFGAKRQKLSLGKHDSVNNIIYKWFMNARERNVPIGEHIIKEKALDFANIADFKASEGTISGEERSRTAEKTSSWEQANLPIILSRYELRDVYNADEFGLFYQQSPTKTFHLKDERCAGGKLSKVRLTGLAAGNGVVKKLSMFIIGKAEKPRCFKSVKSLPCQYKSQNNSWMDSKIFTDYVRRLDAKFNAEGRKVALIIDNCPAHPNIENLKAIVLVFLRPNTTSKTQPMDEGIIRALKTFYRTNVVRRQIKYIDVGKTTPNINILEAMSMLVKSWDAVSTKTLSAAFYNNCINRPLVDLPDDIKVIEILAPIKLRLLNENTNRIYKYLEKYFQSTDITLSANHWNQSLGFEKPKLHGGQFKGGKCSKLLKITHVLEKLIKPSKLEKDEHIISILNSFKCLKPVKAACLFSGLLP
ncbi:tigger transposable element-derived protein 4-like [Hydra vulgaris]|uniref:Tigger transposable element-derived protein 4-like n=1 Tax=Hydra vulgaris TaxID=6087 RepID=A0ABM4B1W2_HYDVU